VLDNRARGNDFFNRFVDNTLLERLDAVINAEFARVTYTEAIELLLKSGKGFEYPVKWGIDLQTEHERYITEKISESRVCDRYIPSEIKAFLYPPQRRQKNGRRDGFARPVGGLRSSAAASARNGLMC
jgi:asparaginyl-tRNA synthetase